MREIKFRAWDNERKEMDESFTLEDIASGYDCGYYCAFFRPKFDIFQEGVILMEYTGLKDKNGVEIYEGDIVDNDGDLFKVVYMDARFMGESEDGLLDFPTKNWLVVGNLYENPNLLSQDK